MLEHPKTYEEARIILKDSANDDYMKHCQKRALLRGGLVTLLCVGAASLVGLKYGSNMIIDTIPIGSMISLSSFIPYFINKDTQRLKRTEKYIKGKSEEQVISLASHYVDEYNDFKRRRSR